MEEEKAKELAEQLDVNHFDRRLQDGVQRFITLIEQSKKDLSKNELVSLRSVPKIFGLGVKQKMILPSLF